MVLIFLLAVCALIGVALYSSTRGGGNAVSESDLGGINSFDSYYGKDKHKYKAGPPCEKCVRTGCIGAGNCRCLCHGPALQR